jgi:hypothetical protein
LRRITVVAEPACEELLQRECLARGASGFTVTPSRGVGRHNVHDGTWETTTGIRLETIVPFQVSEGLLRYLREEVMNKYHPTVSVETIEVLLPDQFLQADTTESALVHHG